jgi:hypothetical protein
VVRLTPPVALHPGRKLSLPIKQEAGSASEPMYTLQRRGKFLTLIRNRTTISCWFVVPNLCHLNSGHFDLLLLSYKEKLGPGFKSQTRAAVLTKFSFLPCGNSGIVPQTGPRRCCNRPASDRFGPASITSGQIVERPAKCGDVNKHTNIPNFQTLCNFISVSVLHS